MKFQRRSWTVERVAWVSLGIIALAAALGLLSHGPLSRTTATSDDGGLAVSYERLERRQASSQFLVRAAAGGQSQEIKLRFGPDFLDTYNIRTMTPAPLRASTGAQGYEPVFAASPSGQTRVHISGRAVRFGFARFDVEAIGNGAVRVRQFIFP